MLKNFRKTVYLFLFCLISMLCFSQEKRLNGIILVDFLNEYPQGVVITNRTTKVYSISDLSGSFQINASLGDTLLLQGTFLEDRKFVVRASSFTYNPLVIHMNHDVIKLEDMIVKAPLTGDLQKDIKSVEVRDDVEKLYANLGIDIRTLDMDPKERKEDMIPKLGPIPIPTSLNVEALYKSISGYYRRMENLNQYERLERRLWDVKEYLGTKYFENILNVPENEIREFLLFCYDQSNGEYESFYLQKDYLSIDRILRKFAPAYLQRIKERGSVE